MEFIEVSFFSLPIDYDFLFWHFHFPIQTKVLEPLTQVFQTRCVIFKTNNSIILARGIIKFLGYSKRKPVIKRYNLAIALPLSCLPFRLKDEFGRMNFYLNEFHFIFWNNKIWYKKIKTIYFKSVKSIISIKINWLKNIKFTIKGRTQGSPLFHKTPTHI